MKLDFRLRKHTNYIIIHDSHTPPSVTNAYAYLRHKGRQMGLLEIGYHLVIDRGGGVHPIRPVDTMGAHTPGFDDEAVGVCLLGGRDEDDQPDDNFTTAQRSALLEVLGWVTYKYPVALVVGHSELARYRDRKRRCPMLNMSELRAKLEGSTA